MEYVETEFAPKASVLVDLQDKIKKAGLSFHPYIAITAINKEVENRLTDLIANQFKGVSIEILGQCSMEIKEYAESEEKKYQEFQRVMNTPPAISDVKEVTEDLEAPIKLIDKRKKKK